jgi:hypothetical protein
MTLSDKQYLSKMDKRASAVKKLLKHLKEEIIEDFGKECEDWEEECIICQVHKAIRVLENAYLDEDNK